MVTITLVVIVTFLSAIIIVGSLSVFIFNVPLFGTSKPNRTIVSSTIPLKEKWIYEADAPISARPVVDGDRVLVRTQRHIIAVDAETGKELWRYSSDPAEIPARAPVVGYDTAVFHNGGNETIEAIDVNNGKRLWTWSAPPFQGYISSFLVTRDIVYVSISRGCDPLVALSRTTGEMLWKTGALENGECHGGDLELRPDGLYLVTGPSMYVLDPDNGDVQRSLVDKFRGGGYQPLLGNNLFWTTGGSVIMPELPTLVAQDIYRGGTRWEFDGYCKPLDNEPLYPNLLKGHIFAAGGCHAIFSFAPDTGNVLWKSEISSNATSLIVQMDNLGYVASDDASIIAFDLDTGESRGRLETNPPTTFLKEPKIASDGVSLYATFGDNNLYAFGK